MVGIDEDDRFGCEFGLFFADPPVGTPKELLAANLYGEVAVPLKGGRWRKTSLMQLAERFTSHDPKVVAEAFEEASRRELSKYDGNLSRLSRGVSSFLLVQSAGTSPVSRLTRWYQATDCVRALGL